MYPLLCAAFLLAAITAPSLAQTVVIRAGHLVDVVNGQIIDNQYILPSRRMGRRLWICQIVMSCQD